MTRVYQYDVFISYPREARNVSGWVREHFSPLLKELLDDEITRHVKVFVDDKVPAGAKWSLEAKTALLHSRVLIPVCAPKYFVSEWCLAEWHSMAHRERVVGMGSEEDPRGLILPVVYSDSMNFPTYVSERVTRDFKAWAVPFQHYQHSPKYLEFYEALKEFAVELAELLESVPQWQPDWPVHTPTPDPLKPPDVPRL